MSALFEGIRIAANARTALRACLPVLVGADRQQRPPQIAVEGARPAVTFYGMAIPNRTYTIAILA